MKKLQDLRRELINTDRLLPLSYGSVREAIQKARVDILRRIEEIELPFKEELQLCDDLDKMDDLAPCEEE